MEKEMGRKIDFTKHTKEELIALAVEVNAGKVFGSWNILNVRLNPLKLGIVFRPVALAYSIEKYIADKDEGWNNKQKKFVLKKFKRGYPVADDIRHFYEYMDKAVETNFRNTGLPMFITCRALDADECVTLASQMEKLEAEKKYATK